MIQRLIVLFGKMLILIRGWLISSPTLKQNLDPILATTSRQSPNTTVVEKERPTKSSHGILDLYTALVIAQQCISSIAELSSV
jgi:hypothetical protein